MMTFPNSSGVARRPRASTVSCICWPSGVGGLPTRPADASAFWERIAAATSSAVMPSAVIRLGSIQTRMA